MTKTAIRSRRRVNGSRVIVEIAQSLIQRHAFTRAVVVPEFGTARSTGYRAALERTRVLTPTAISALLLVVPDAELDSVHGDSEWRGADDGQRDRRRAATAIAFKIHALLSHMPVFRHDCTRCEYLGQMTRVASSYLDNIEAWGGNSALVDLYFCDEHAGSQLGEIIVRYGDGPAGFFLFSDVVSDHDLHEKEGPLEIEPHVAGGLERVSRLS